MRRTNQTSSAPRALFDLDIDNLLHPGQAFEHPRNVVDDPDLTLNEKRASLCVGFERLYNRGGSGPAPGA